jgi:hypothetical protein
MGNELDRLLQRQRRKWLEDALGTELWTTVYASEKAKDESVGIYSAFVPSAHGPKTLQDDSWDLRIDHVRPCCSQSSKGVSYFRFGTDNGIEPLVIIRSFHGLRPSSIELLEEFRLFHNLYHDPTRNEFIKIDEGGQEEIVARIKEDRVDIKTVAIRQYLAIKEMHLAIFIDSKTFSPLAIDDVPVSDRRATVHTDRVRYFCIASPWDFTDRGKTVSRLLGKKLIAPLPKEQSGFWPYNEEEEEKHEDFIIGVDEAGKPVTYTSNPDKLANYFGANPTAPHYLTPVFFRREVLAKYFQQPQKYSVRDGHLGCRSLWGVQIDNNHEDYVLVFLGDLGRDLPHHEQVYWKSFNVPPDGTISEVNLRRSFLAEFIDPTSPDLIFKNALAALNTAWQKRFGWPLFLPLHAGDEHHWTALHVPTTDEQAEFDGLLLSLTKILIDSINEAELVKHGVSADTTGSIAKLQEFLTVEKLPAADEQVKLLRNIQSLRSAGVGHRKGSSYPKAATAVGVGAKPLSAVFADLLRAATSLLDALGSHFLAEATKEP